MSRPCSTCVARSRPWSRWRPWTRSSPTVSAGSSVMREDRVERVVEERDATEEQLDLTEINVGLYAFDVAWLRRRLPDIPPSPVTGELYLPILVELARADRRPVAALELPDDGTLTGINDRAQLSDAEVAMRLRINDELMRAGRDHGRPGVRRSSMPRSSWPRTSPSRRTSSCAAPRASAATASSVPARTWSTRWSASAASSGPACSSRPIVEDDVRVGPFAHLRPGAHVGAGAEVGNFAEIKSATLGARSKQHHFSYLGDAQVGDGRQHRRRHHHRQLRWPAEASDGHRRRRVHRLRHHPAGARDHRGGRRHGRRLGGHPRRARRTRRCWACLPDRTPRQRPPSTATRDPA